MTTTTRLREALGLLLDAVDYERGACSATEMVGAVLPTITLRRARDLMTGVVIESEPLLVDLMREALRDLLPVATSDFDLANLTLTEITKRVAKACAALAAADKAAKGGAVSDRPKWTLPTPRDDGAGCAWCGVIGLLHTGDTGKLFCCLDHERWFYQMERAARDMYEALVRLSLETREYLTDKATDEALAKADAALAKARGE